MKTCYPRITVLALAIGLAGVTSGCGKSHHDEAATPAALPPTPVVSSSAGSLSAAPPSVAGSDAAVAPAAGAAKPRHPAGAGPQSATKSGAHAAAARCSGRSLTAALRIQGLSGGTQNAALTVRNKTAQPCTLAGFPDLQLLGHGDDPVSTLVLRAGPAGVLRLSAGGTAWAQLRWGTTPASDEPAGGCEPAASRLAVFAPGDRTQINLDYSAGPVCQHGRVQANAFRAGLPTT
jgi:hypothetical protein